MSDSDNDIELQPLVGNNDGAYGSFFEAPSQPLQPNEDIEEINKNLGSLITAIKEAKPLPKLKKLAMALPAKRLLQNETFLRALQIQFILQENKAKYAWKKLLFDLLYCSPLIAMAALGIIIFMYAAILPCLGLGLTFSSAFKPGTLPFEILLWIIGASSFAMAALFAALLVSLYRSNPAVKNPAGYEVIADANEHPLEQALPAGARQQFIEWIRGKNKIPTQSELTPKILWQLINKYLVTEGQRAFAERLYQTPEVVIEVPDRTLTLAS